MTFRQLQAHLYRAYGRRVSAARPKHSLAHSRGVLLVGLNGLSKGPYRTPKEAFEDLSALEAAGVL